MIGPHEALAPGSGDQAVRGAGAGIAEPPILPRLEWRHARWAAASIIGYLVLLIVVLTLRQLQFQAGQYPTNGRNLGDMIAMLVAITALVAALLQLAWRVLGWPPIVLPQAGRWRRALGWGLFAAAVLIWIVPLGEEWSRSIMYKWRYLMLIGSAGGVIQIIDASGYYYDARSLLYDLPLTYTRRPFSTTYLSSWLLLSGNRLTLTLTLNALLLGAATAIVSRLVAWRLGWSAALLFWAVLFSFGFPVIGTTLTEPAALLLGILGAGFLLAGAIDRRPGLALIGVFLAALAIDTRAGAFLVIPALVAWFAVSFGGPWRKWLQRGALALAVAAAGPGVNWGLSRFFGQGAYQGNFAYVLYGFTHAKPWTAALYDNPELTEQIRTGAFTPEALTRHLLRQSFQRLREHPSDSWRSLVDGLKAYGSTDPGGAFVFFTQPYSFIPYQEEIRAAVFVLAALGVGWLVLSIRQPLGGLGLLVLAGTVASAPFIATTAGYRVFAATVPFEALLLAAGGGLLAGRRATPPAGAVTRMTRVPLLAITAFMMVMGLAIPVIRKPFIPEVESRWEDSSSTTLVCRPGTESPVLSIVSGPERGFLEGLWPGVPHRVRAADFILDEGLGTTFPGIAKHATAESSFELIDAFQLEPQGFSSRFYLVSERLDFPRDGRLVRFHLQPDWDPLFGPPIRRVVSFDVLEP